jgi:hypothetical protein
MLSSNPICGAVLIPWEYSLYRTTFAGAFEIETEMEGWVARPETEMACADGVRMSKFRKAVSKTLDATLTACSFEAFRRCFPPLGPEQDELLFELHTQLLHVVSTHVQARAIHISALLHFSACDVDSKSSPSS